MVLKCIPLSATWQCTSKTGQTLVTGLENGLERKKIVSFSWWKDVEALQGELKIKQKDNK